MTNIPSRERRGGLGRGAFVGTAVAAGAWLLLASNAFAEVAVEARAHVGVSDNLNRAPEGGNEIEDTIQIVSTNFLINGATNRTSTAFLGNLAVYHYVQESFDDELLGGATFNFTGDLLPERIRWVVNDHFGQGPIDALQVITPANRQTINVFRTGPQFAFRIADRTGVELDLLRSVMNFERSNTDSERSSGRLAFTRQHTQRWATSIGASTEHVKFVDVDGFDLDRNTYFVSAILTGSRSTLTMSAGPNEIESEFGEGDGTRYSVAFSRELSGPGVITVNALRGFSDAGNLFRLGQSFSLDITEAQDIFATPDPFESTLAYVRYGRTGPLGSWLIQGFTRKDDYLTQTQFNRDEIGIRFALRRSVQRYWELSVDGRSARRELEAVREEDTHAWSVEVTRRIGRTLGVGFRAEHFSRDQRQFGADRAENRFYVFFSYRRQPIGLVQQPPAIDEF